MPNMSAKTMYIYASILVAFIILMIFLGVFYNKSRRIEQFSNESTKSPEDFKKNRSNNKFKPSKSSSRFESKPTLSKPEAKPILPKRPIDKPSIPKRPSPDSGNCENQTLKDSINISLKNNDKLKKHLQEMIKNIDEDSKKINENIQDGLLKCKRLR